MGHGVGTAGTQYPPSAKRLLALLLSAEIVQGKKAESNQCFLVLGIFVVHTDKKNWKVSKCRQILLLLKSNFFFFFCFIASEEEDRGSEGRNREGKGDHTHWN